MSLVDRAKNIITSPKTEWAVIGAEEASVGGVFTGYVIPMALIPAVANFIGYGFVGILGMSGIEWGIAQGILSFLTTMLAVFLAAFVIDLLAASFGSQKNLGRAMQLVAYSYTPSWVGGILGIYPPLAFLGMLFGLYGIYLMYLGFPHTMQTPQDKVVIYMIVAVVVLVIVYAILAAVLTGIIFGIFGLTMLSMLG